MLPDSVRILPLGGLGEIGKNCMVMETGGDIIVIDLGLQFPSDDMLGVDLVIPDIAYLREHRDQIRGIFITHGHEDHIGALPYLIADLDAPVYATPLTAGLIAVKLREHHLLDRVSVRTMQPGDVVEAGWFSVEPLPVTHSIPDCVAFKINTPTGIIVHTGDFKFDDTPVYGPPTDKAALARLGDRGVLALLCDCVRIEKPGHTPSETIVDAAFDTIISRAKGRVIIATFASNISRIQQAINVAARYGRKAAVAGRSMANNCSIATDLGFIQPGNTLVKMDEALRQPPDKIVLITTGSQGEPSSALSRMANNDHRQIKIIPGDTVVVSATAIPGNEETVSHTIDNLMRLGAEVIYEPLDTVHVSGHASQDEIRQMIQLLRPKYAIPLHGEYRQMTLFRRIAEEAGVSPENIHLIEVGDMLEVAEDYAEQIDHISVNSVLVDGVTVGAASEAVLRDRQHLSRDGVIIAVVTVDRMTGELLAEPEIIARGIPKPEPNGNGEMIEGAREQIRNMLAKGPLAEVEYGFLSHKIRETLGQYVYKQLRTHPMILPVITEI